MSEPNTEGRVVSINVSAQTGIAKSPVPSVEVVLDRGIDGDAHAGDWHRQVSLLAMESVQRMRDAGADVNPGAFGENLTVLGLDLLALPLGTEIEIGSARLQVSQHGKVCHDHCAIYHQVGDCVMPREGIFGVVTQAGTIAEGDHVTVLSLGEGTFERVGAAENA
jgi:MOSC domain-containing protein YiiM